MIKEKAMELVSALRSGKYRQAQKYLYIGNHQYCCLGVACRISKLGKFKAGAEEDDSVGKYYRCGDNSSNATLPKAVRQFFDFFDEEGARKDGSNLVIDGGNRSLVQANPLLKLPTTSSRTGNTCEGLPGNNLKMLHIYRMFHRTELTLWAVPENCLTKVTGMSPRRSPISFSNSARTPSSASTAVTYFRKFLTPCLSVMIFSSAWA